jgi:hypothetical protein
LVLLGAVLGLTSCDSQTTEPDAQVEELSAKKDITPMKMGCIDHDNPGCLPIGPGDDPSPNAGGVWMGVGGGTLTETWCTTNGNDIDHDGLDDHCEYRLAWTFRPLMRSYKWDDVSGEPYYVVEELGGDYRIIYMLAYYEDWGHSATWHPITSPGHIGDSEFVAVDVDYNSSTQHWEVQGIIASCHFEALSDCTYWRGHGDWEYPEQDRWYPRVYVSVNKHAGYPSDSACDSGVGGAEECPSPKVSWRVPVTQGWNVGSRDYPAADVPYNQWGNDYTCVQSRDVTERTIMGRTAGECFWDNGPVDFAGWMPVTGVTGYSYILQELQSAQ